MMDKGVYESYVAEIHREDGLVKDRVKSLFLCQTILFGIRWFSDYEGMPGEHLMFPLAFIGAVSAFGVLLSCLGAFFSIYRYRALLIEMACQARDEEKRKYPFLNRSGPDLACGAAGTCLIPLSFLVGWVLVWACCK